MTGHEMTFGPDPSPDRGDRFEQRLKDAEKELADLRRENSALWSGIGRLEEDLADAAKRIAKLERIVDQERGEAVRAAIQGGAVVTDAHRRHDAIAEMYRSVVRNDMQTLARKWWLQSSKRTSDELVAARAGTIAHLTRVLLEDLDRPLPATADSIVADLRDGQHIPPRPEARYRTDADAQSEAEIVKLLESLLGRISKLRDMIEAAPLSAHFEFGVGIGALRPGEFEVWNDELRDDGVPGILIAPAYVVRGENQAQRLTKHVVLFQRPGTS
jgi:hypothetical protein